jgi:hypothetical protein
VDRLREEVGLVIRLGADAWSVLSAQLGGLRLAAPFLPGEPVLDAPQRAAAEAALRASPVVPGTSGRLADDLAPAVKRALLAHALPEVLVVTQAGLGDDVRAARHALQAGLVGVLRREQRAEGDGVALGPVEVAALSAEGLVPDVLDVLGDFGGAAGREAVELGAAEAAAMARALADGRAGLAEAVAGGPVPGVVAQLAGGLRAIAQVSVAAAGGVHVVVLVRTDDGWWHAAGGLERLVLEPVDADALATLLAGEVAAALDGAPRRAA